jgi:hypothetical protein
MPRVAPAPEKFTEMCPGEPWFIWVHLEIGDWTQSSFGATSGFMAPGTELELLTALEVEFTEGPLAGMTKMMLQVRGQSCIPADDGDDDTPSSPPTPGPMIIGWTPSDGIEGL